MPSIFKIKGESLVGKVTEKKVILYRAVPFQGNSFLPVFVGSFIRINNKTILKGKWTYHLYTKIIGIFMFTLFIYKIVFQLIKNSEISISSIVVYSMIILSILFSIKIGKWLSKDDKWWIIKYVEHVFSS